MIRGEVFKAEYTGKLDYYEIPADGDYRITVKGARSADGASKKGGRGAVITSTFSLKKGDKLDMLVGQISTRKNVEMFHAKR